MDWTLPQGRARFSWISRGQWCLLPFWILLGLNSANLGQLITETRIGVVINFFIILLHSLVIWKREFPNVFLKNTFIKLISPLHWFIQSIFIAHLSCALGPARQHLTFVLFLFHTLGLGRLTSTHLEWAPRTLLCQRSSCNLWCPQSHVDQDPRIKRDCATRNPEKRTLCCCSLGPRGCFPNMTEHPELGHAHGCRSIFRPLGIALRDCLSRHHTFS